MLCLDTFVKMIESPLWMWVALAATLLPAATSVPDAVVTAFRSRGKVTITESGGNYVFAANGIPDHTTGTFPNPSNPNSIQTKSYQFTIPKTATTSEESCLPMGAIGIAITGVPFYNPYTIEGTDAVVTETFDSCEGHPDPQGNYHYHHAPACVVQAGVRDQIVGVAFDGFPIYGPLDANGKTLKTADLDRCHGRTVNGQYRYHLTVDFPYILGCFKGSLDSSTKQSPGFRECRFAKVGNAGATLGPAQIVVYIVLLCSVLLFTD